MTNLKRIADTIESADFDKLIIRGYASPEGNLPANEKLARVRANQVEIELKNIGISEKTASKISSEGMGVMPGTGSYEEKRKVIFHVPGLCPGTN